MIPDLDLLARLRDAHPPPEPGWWPPAPGWWIALALAIALGVLALRWAPPRWRRWRLRRRLLAALDAIAARHRAGAPQAAVVAELSGLLRLAALLAFPQRDAAGLHGGEWIEFLDRAGGARRRFEPLREALTVAPYAPPAACPDAAPLIRAARDWLRAAV
jgi:hypothetical protein